MFRAVPIAADVVADARARLAVGDPAVTRVIADSNPGYPCRRCLRDADVGEAMVLFLYRPFAETGPYAEAGPVLAHEHDCTPAALAVGDVPEVTRVRAQCVVRAYDGRNWIAGGQLCDAADAAATIHAFFEDAAVAYAHVRNVGYGCFAYAVERAP